MDATKKGTPNFGNLPHKSYVTSESSMEKEVRHLRCAHEDEDTCLNAQLSSVLQSGWGVGFSVSGARIRDQLTFKGLLHAR